MSPVPRRLLALATLVSLSLVGAAPVAAHTELVSATPADGAHIDAPPASVELTFSDELNPEGSSVTVTGPDGKTAGSGGVDLDIADRNVLTATLEPAGNGTYTVAWTSVAIDGHVANGTLSFSVGDRQLADTALPAPHGDGALAGWLLVIAAATLVVLRRTAAR